ncbi:MAG: T9SS type B sorting domain-containing protein [Bacteroidota bacterium]
MRRFSIKCLLIIPFWLSHQTSLYAQKEANIWYFGRSAGLNFNTDPPTVIEDSKMTTMEGCSSISDEDGNLLFYTDGQIVWNRFHEKMSNGTGLNGNGSSTHSSVIVKKPFTDSIYYIITSDKGICYSVVDMRENNGRGNVLEKNTKMVAKSAEKIAATIHRNGSDVWIAVPEAGTNNIEMFLLTENGMFHHHVIRDFFISGFANWGQMKFSPDSKVLALTNPTGPSGSSDTRISIADFDNLTGTISNPKILTGAKNVYGLEFSPSSKLLYFGTWLGVAGASGLFQYDLTSIDNNFLTACYKVAPEGNGQLQLASNGKIYIPNDPLSLLSVINYPDSAGAKCSFSSQTVSLGNGRSWFGLPTFYSSYINRNRIRAEHTCFGDLSFIYTLKDTLKYDSARWFADTAQIHNPYFSFHHRFPDTGYVLIKLVAYKQNLTDTFVKFVYIKPTSISKPVLSDVKLCSGDSAILNAYTNPGAVFEWSTGSTDSAITTYVANDYVVKISQQGCSIWDTVNVAIQQPIQRSLPADTFFCQHADVILSIHDPTLTCLWSTGDTSHAINVAQSGWYSVRLSKEQCRITDSVNVSRIDVPHIYLGEDTLVCASIPFILDATFPYSQYRWSTQSNKSTLNANRDGTYWVEVSNICGIASDTIEIFTKECECVFFIPNAFTPNNDRINDLFGPRLNCSTLEYSFKLFDRWGQLLFESNDPLDRWDGTVNKLSCGVDTYFWTVSYAMAPPIGDGQLLSRRGTVTLLR